MTDRCSSASGSSSFAGRGTAIFRPATDGTGDSPGNRLDGQDEQAECESRERREQTGEQSTEHCPHNEEDNSSNDRGESTVHSATSPPLTMYPATNPPMRPGIA